MQRNLGQVERQSLHDDDNPYRSLFNHVPHATFFVDLAGRCRAINPASCSMTGYSEAEFLTLRFDAIVHPDDLPDVVAAFRDVVAREPRTLECRVLHKDGAIVEVTLTGVPVIIDGEVTGVHGVAEDVTIRNQALRELEEARRVAEGAQRVAEEANAAKSLFLANISHELRTPLAGNLAALELLQEVGELSPQGDKLLSTALRSGKKLARLVDDLLSLSQHQTGGIKVDPEAFDMRDVLDSALAEVTAAVRTCGLTLAVQVAGDVPVRMVGDHVRISQVLSNVLDNALKFTEHGSISVAVDVAQSRPHDLDLRIRVSDTGIGIAPEHLDQLFDPFMQGDPSMTRRFGGAGLGLPICRDLVQLMSGSINIDSEPEVGTTVTVVLSVGTEE